mgnify:CR=1 FL=1
MHAQSDEVSQPGVGAEGRRRVEGPLFMRELLAQLQPGEAVLDLGCGRGSFAYADYPALRIDALDVAPPEVSFPSHVTFRLGRAEKLPYPDEAFRLVIAHYVFEHFADFVQALLEAERVLRVGGWLYMSAPNARSFEDLLYRALFAGGGHLQQPTLEWIMRQVYEHTGLKLVTYCDWPAAMTFFGDHEEMRAFTTAVLHTFQRVTGQDLRAAANYVLLFRKEETIGYRFAPRACTYCGDGASAGPGAPELRPLAGSGNSAEQPLESWECPFCGRRNVLAVEAADLDPARLQADLERFERDYGGRLKRSGYAPPPVATAGGLAEAVATPFSPVEVQELRWLAKGSLWFRSHLRLYYFFRRLKRLVVRAQP